MSMWERYLPIAYVVVGIVVAVPVLYVFLRALVGFIREPWLWLLDRRPEALRAATGAVKPFLTRRPPVHERSFRLYVGRRGKGKTLMAVYDALVRMRRGEKVYSNIDICDARYGLRAGRVYCWDQIMDLEDCTLVIDEVNLWAGSRQWQSVTPEQLTRWSQSRHVGVGMIMTAQHEDRVDRVVRELLDDVVIVERPSWLPRWFPLFWAQWTWLEEIDQIRRGDLSRREALWMPDEVYYSYDSHGSDSMVEVVNAKDGFEFPPLRHPERMVRQTGEFVPWAADASGAA